MQLTSLGAVVKVTALRRIVGSETTDVAGSTWEWRLDDYSSPFRAARGPLAAGGSARWQGVEWQSIFRSPRMVSPDGRCQIYLSPFSNPRGSSAWRRFGVFGDSLVSSLGDPLYNAKYPQGYVEGVFNANKLLVEVEGQSGRRWTPVGSNLDAADSYLRDEFRGLVARDVDGVVSALGANDAAALAFFTAAAQLAAARTSVHGKLTEVLDEMASSPVCVVAVTTVEHPVTVLGVYSDDAYPREARAINRIVRELAAGNPNDALRVYDFAAEAKAHQYGSAAPWFISDNLHLNSAGKLIYTNIMLRAANRCGL